MDKNLEVRQMTISTHGNDKGFILFGALIILFCVSVLFLGILEYEYSNLLRTKKQYTMISENVNKMEVQHEAY